MRYDNVVKNLVETPSEGGPLFEPMLMDFNSWTANILDPIIYPAVQKANAELLEVVTKKRPSSIKAYYQSLSRVLTSMNIELYLRDRQFEWFKKVAHPEHFKNLAIQFEVRNQFAQLAETLI